MRLIAIYNAWSDCLDLLKKSIENILPVVDEVIVMWSDTSNRGNFKAFEFPIFDKKVRYYEYYTMKHLTPHTNETAKRNMGIEYARSSSATHILMMDCDEFYFQDDIKEGKKIIKKFDLNGMVCPLKVYVAKPTLWCEDHTLVPFIHKLTPELKCGDFPNYPFTYDDTGHCHIDPTRRYNVTDKIYFNSEIVMHHYSWVRENIELKIENSSANLLNSRKNIKEELENAKPGWKSLLYHRELKESPNYFNI